jgi:hypothetical protein
MFHHSPPPSSASMERRGPHRPQLVSAPPNWSGRFAAIETRKGAASGQWDRGAGRPDRTRQTGSATCDPGNGKAPRSGEVSRSPSQVTKRDPARDGPDRGMIAPIRPAVPPRSPPEFATADNRRIKTGALAVGPCLTAGLTGRAPHLWRAGDHGPPRHSQHGERGPVLALCRSPSLWPAGSYKNASQERTTRTHYRTRSRLTMHKQLSAHCGSGRERMCSYFDITPPAGARRRPAARLQLGPLTAVMRRAVMDQS